MKFEDGEDYCTKWLGNYAKLQSLLYMPPFVIIVINTMLKFVLRKFVIFEKRRNITSELVSATTKMFIVQFLNTAILLLVINGGIAWITYSDSDVHEDFSVEWYRDVGATLIMTMLMNVFTPHVANAMWQFIYGVQRCCDRRCTCNKKRTKQLLQEDYENINTGNIFMFEFRYSQVLTQVYVTMMYSAGIPLLYPVSMVSFLMTYWVDKYLFIRHYKNPPSYTMAMAERTVLLMRYSLILHFIIGFLMLSNSKILTSKNKDQLEEYVTSNQYYVFA